MEISRLTQTFWPSLNKYRSYVIPWKLQRKIPIQFSLYGSHQVDAKKRQRVSKLDRTSQFWVYHIGFEEVLIVHYSGRKAFHNHCLSDRKGYHIYMKSDWCRTHFWYLNASYYKLKFYVILTNIVHIFVRIRLDTLKVLK